MTRTRIVMLVVAAALGLVVSMFIYSSLQPATIHLRFTAAVGDKALVFNEPIYDNPGGTGVFKVRDFQMYLSNIQLVGATGTYIVPDSYHLARFDNATNTYEIVIEAAPNAANPSAGCSRSRADHVNGGLVQLPGGKEKGCRTDRR